MKRKKALKLRYVCIYHKKERSYKVAVYINHHVLIKRKEVIKLRFVHIITCSSKEKKL